MITKSRIRYAYTLPLLDDESIMEDANHREEVSALGAFQATPFISHFSA